jgi:hypothetical protein
MTLLSTACSQKLHHRCPGRGPAGAVRCDCPCHTASASEPGDIRFGDAQLLREADQDQALAQALGFHPLMGGRRIGEMRCSSLQNGQVYLEMPGSFVSVAQVKAISKILTEQETN